MKKIILLSTILVCISCKTKKTQNEVFFINSTNTVEKYDLPNTTEGKIIVGMIDSLNLKDFKIPKAFDNLYMDYDYNKAYVTYGKAISTRRFIINRVNNLQALQAIEVSSKYSEIPDPNFIKKNFLDFVYDMPFINMSIKDLVRDRIKELEN